MSSKVQILFRRAYRNCVGSCHRPRGVGSAGRKSTFVNHVEIFRFGCFESFQIELFVGFWFGYIVVACCSLDARSS